MLIRDGRLDERVMNRERLSGDEIVAGLRLRGIDGLERVRLGYLEDSGSISALLDDGPPGTRQPAAQRSDDGKKLWENVGSVRFELTIDGSLRCASVLQRVITDSGDPLFITRTRPLEPVAIPD